MNKQITDYTLIHNVSQGEILTADMLNSLIHKVNEYQPAVAVIRCGHCGQWGARFCECPKCGAPIE